MQQQVFDTYAKTYDEHFTNSLIGQTQRLQVYKQLSKHISFQNKAILEINCGTGEDAIWFAKQGANVLATDISEAMIHVAKTKSGNSSVEFIQLESQNILSLTPDKYDLIFSNFGGLNCLNENEWKQFRNGCSQLQTKGHQLAFVIMGTQCWWERFYFWLQKDKVRSARRSNKDGVETVMNSNEFKTYYYSPHHIIELFNGDYSCVSVKPIGLFVPPSYLEPYFKNRKTVFRFLECLDKVFGNFSFLSNYADHYLIVFEKNSN